MKIGNLRRKGKWGKLDLIDGRRTLFESTIIEFNNYLTVHISRAGTSSSFAAVCRLFSRSFPPGVTTVKVDRFVRQKVAVTKKPICLELLHYVDDVSSVKKDPTHHLYQRRLYRTQYCLFAIVPGLWLVVRTVLRTRVPVPNKVAFLSSMSASLPMTTKLKMKMFYMCECLFQAITHLDINIVI